MGINSEKITCFWRFQKSDEETFWEFCSWWGCPPFTQDCGLHRGNILIAWLTNFPTGSLLNQSPLRRAAPHPYAGAIKPTNWLLLWPFYSLCYPYRNLESRFFLCFSIQPQSCPVGDTPQWISMLGVALSWQHALVATSIFKMRRNGPGISSVVLNPSRGRSHRTASTLFQVFAFVHSPV